MYFLPMGVLHLMAFVVGCIVFAALAFRQRGSLPRRVGRLGLFLGLLLIIGSLANGLWSCSVWGRLYRSSETVFDFSPFWPITRSGIDSPFDEDMTGQLFGVSIFQLQLFWLLFAAGTWTATIISYLLICRRRPANTSAEHDDWAKTMNRVILSIVTLLVGGAAGFLLSSFAVRPAIVSDRSVNSGWKDLDEKPGYGRKIIDASNEVNELIRQQSEKFKEEHGMMSSDFDAGFIPTGNGNYTLKIWCSNRSGVVEGMFSEYERIVLACLQPHENVLKQALDAY
jgi:hypothetical protein